MYLNCQSLNKDTVNYINSEFVAQNNNIRFLCFTETWTCEASVKSILFDNFINLTSYSRSSINGGGVGIWAHKELNGIKQINLHKFCIEQIIEICGISWRPRSFNSKKIVILTCYRSPSSNKESLNLFLKNLGDVLELVYKPNVAVLVNGDFTLDPIRDLNQYR